MEHRRWMNVYLVYDFEYNKVTNKENKMHSQLLDLKKIEEDKVFKESMIKSFKNDLQPFFNIPKLFKSERK